MSLSSVLDVAIGLMVVYYLFGSIVSLITQLVNETFETRGDALEKRLLEMMGDKTKLGDLFNLPQMQSLRPIRYKNIFSAFTFSTEAKKLEKIPVSMLVDGFFDIANLTKQGEQQAAQVLAAIKELPESEVRNAFLTWANQGINNVKDLRTRATDYFAGVLDQAAAKFRSQARSIVIMLSIFLTLLFGTDTIQLAQTIWNSAELRAVAAAQAQAIVKEEGAQADMTSIIDQLGEYSIRVGWWQVVENRPAAGAPASDWVWFVFLKTLGLSITAFAVSQGSSFWYDLLKKVANPSRAFANSEPKG